MKWKSDWQAVAQMTCQGAHSMTPTEVYQALAALANNGEKRIEEDGLCGDSKALIAARRAMSLNHSKEALSLVQAVLHRCKEPIIRGDAEFLKANIIHRKGGEKKSIPHWGKACEAFADGSLDHRYQRALINFLICQAKSESYMRGELFALYQESIRRGYHDLAGNISKAAAGQFLEGKNYLMAQKMARRAQQDYLIDGCPEDLAVARVIEGMATCALGDIEMAQVIRKEFHWAGGKIGKYLSSFDQLLKGQAKNYLSIGGLQGVEWPRVGVKSNSISAKILTELEKGKVSRDELIYQVWGPNADHPSYCSRLYAALNQLRKKQGRKIEFDGEFYKLVL